MKLWYLNWSLFNAIWKNPVIRSLGVLALFFPRWFTIWCYFLAPITEQNLHISCIFLYKKSAGWEFERPSGHCWESQNQLFVENLHSKTDTEANHPTTFIWANAYEVEFLAPKPHLWSHSDGLHGPKANAMHAFQLHTLNYVLLLPLTSKQTANSPVLL